MSGERNCLFDTSKVADRLLPVGGPVIYCMHCSSRSAILRRNMGTYLHLQFISHTEDQVYARQLTLIVQNCLELNESAPVTHSSESVVLPLSFDSLYLLKNFA